MFVSPAYAQAAGDAGAGALIASGIGKTVAFIFVSPLLGFLLGSLMMVMVAWVCRRAAPNRVDRWFRRLQLVSAGAYSLGHGGNDAQKTIGIIWLLLIATGYSSATDASPPTWTIVSCYVAIGLGTMFGGWRIVKTMGQRLTKIKPFQGCCAETGGAITLFMATGLGIPVSTTDAVMLPEGYAANLLYAWGDPISDGPRARADATSSFAMLRRNARLRKEYLYRKSLEGKERAAVEISQLIFFTQVLRDGIFHADMHPGNIYVGDQPEDFGRYIALDFGIVGTLSDVDKQYLAQNFLAFFRQDYKRVAELHVQSGWVPKGTRIDELESAIRACIEPFFGKPLKEISLGQALMRLFQTSRRFNVEIQPQLVLLQKTLLNVEGLGRQLDPDLDLWKTAKPYLENWMHQQIGFKGFQSSLQWEAAQWSQILPALPRLLHQNLTQSNDRVDNQIEQLVKQQKRLNRALFWMVLMLAVLFGVVALDLLWPYLVGYAGPQGLF